MAADRSGRLGRVAAAIAVAVAVAVARGPAGALGAVEAPSPRTDVPWKCRVCEDAVQTWHDQFPCAGGSTDWGDSLSSNIEACKGTRFRCNSLGGALRDACLSTETELAVSDGLKARKLWEGMMLHADAYQTCVDLQKCPAEANMEDKDTWSPCLKTFRNTSLHYRPYAPEYAQNCEESCYLCLQLVEYWPRFGEICRPEGAELPQSVPLPGDQAPDQQQSFVEVAAAADAEARARRRRVSGGALNPPAVGGEQPQTELQTGLTLTRECHRMWKTIESQARARYFTSWKRYVNILSNNLDRLDGRMWDANIVCKCLGHCEMSRFEDIGLMDACAYGDLEEQSMKLIFEREGKIEQFVER